MPPMSPSATTIVLNAQQNHSITYNPSDDTVTAHLPQPTPIEKVANKPKLMLLIHFVQRDLTRKLHPRKIDVAVSLELRIVERIIWQFSNYKQAVRTVHEYTEVGDVVDVSSGMGTTRRELEKPNDAIMRKKMTVTREVRETLLEWLRDILAPENAHNRPKPGESKSERSERSSSRTKPVEVIDLSSPVPEIISEDDELQILPHPKSNKRKRLSSERIEELADPRNLTPTTSPRAAIPRSSNSVEDNFPKLFPTSPLNGPEDAPEPKRPHSVTEVSSEVSSPADNSVQDSSSYPRTMQAVDNEDNEDNEEEEEEEEELVDAEGGVSAGDSVPTPVDNIQAVMQKASFYSGKLYTYARKEGEEKEEGESGVRKYSRKLRRLMRRFKEAEQKESL